MSEYSQAAMEILRKPSETFSWYIVPLFLVILYIYSKEAQKKNWNVLFAAIALWGMDLFNEIWNSIVFHASGFAPVWGAPADSALLLLIGYNIEISFMFAIIGIAAASLLPADKKMKIFGIPNRIVFALLNTLLCVIIECLLNHWGALTWEYNWWAISAPWLVFIIGYLPFFAVCFWVHDMEKMKSKVITVSTILGIDILLIIIFGAIGWM